MTGEYNCGVYQTAGSKAGGKAVNMAVSEDEHKRTSCAGIAASGIKAR